MDNEVIMTLKMLSSNIRHCSSLTKRELESISKLTKAKERKAQGLFLAEGYKLVRDMLGAFPLKELFISESLFLELENRLSEVPKKFLKAITVLPDSFNFSRLSSQKTPQPALAIFELPAYDLEEVFQAKGLVLFLDAVQDPGNLGTILRTADWFGVEHIVCAEGTADAFAPKVVQATMGALSRVKVHRLSNATQFLEAFDGIKLGTFLEGANIYTSDLGLEQSQRQLLIMGNEGQGISQEVAPFVDRRLTIPTFGETTGSESLNVAIATAICLSEIKRR